eukprot:5063691-Prymnesium_polylepis.1
MGNRRNLGQRSDIMRVPGFSQPSGRVAAHHNSFTKGVPAFGPRPAVGSLRPPIMPGRRGLATRDTVHDSLRRTHEVPIEI